MVEYKTVLTDSFGNPKGFDNFECCPTIYNGKQELLVFKNYDEYLLYLKEQNIISVDIITETKEP